MGSTASKEVASTSRNTTAPSVSNEKRPVSVSVNDISDRLANYLTLDDMSISAVNQNPIEFKTLEDWSQKLLEDPKNRLALSAISNGDVSSIVRQRDASVIDKVHVFSDKVELEGSPITNQRSSGRCWLFASTNVFRVQVQKKYNLDDFQLSQAYLFFYDKLEKSNYFLQNIIETVDEPLDSRLVQTLLGDPVSDGGQWDMVVNLVEKYGLVPQTLYPDAFNASNSSKLNYIVVEKLREFALVLRKVSQDKSTSKATLLALKEKFVRTIHGILVIALGKPPSPNDVLNWEFVDKAGKFKAISTSPLDFYKTIVGFKATDYFSLIHDPRNSYKEPFTVERLGNIVDGKKIEYVNAEIDILKKAAIKSIQNNEPVFFGSDVGKFSERTEGIMDTNAWDYSLAFNTDLGLTKKERLETKSSAMTHAMVLTAVNIVDGKPTRWRVENSWGEDVGKKGYFIMSDDWFNEYVYQVVTTAKYVDKQYVDIWKSKKYNVLPRWDPLGALA
ncbi:Lap3p [Sugiyamaella lignohabitans]|uniref:Cysteine proteinase 1, mitochondrial n=1 Tax=Sugiyamaella lignohabitans TaxID=796027 RepID=A0A167FWM4_9ASCO|nr:Lap3p [Sugiyamaella lignohabitans]ANB15794.1 Lap3p [Sugiyamaella lignohabitans]